MLDAGNATTAVTPGRAESTDKRHHVKNVIPLKGELEPSERAPRSYGSCVLRALQVTSADADHKVFQKREKGDLHHDT